MIGRVPAGCGYCFGVSPNPSERDQSVDDQHSKPVFKTLSLSLDLHLSTLSPPTTLINPCRLLDGLWLWPRRHPVEEHFFERPHVIGQPCRHRRRAGPPRLG
jgi:hypothetical protein